MEDNKCICIDCTHKCYEYNTNMCSDKAYYEWCIKQKKCETENRLLYGGFFPTEEVKNRLKKENNKYLMMDNWDEMDDDFILSMSFKKED